MNLKNEQAITSTMWILTWTAIMGVAVSGMLYLIILSSSPASAEYIGEFHLQDHFEQWIQIHEDGTYTFNPESGMTQTGTYRQSIMLGVTKLELTSAFGTTVIMTVKDGMLVEPDGSMWMRLTEIKK